MFKIEAGKIKHRGILIGEDMIITTENILDPDGSTVRSKYRAYRKAEFDVLGVVAPYYVIDGFPETVVTTLAGDEACSTIKGNNKFKEHVVGQGILNSADFEHGSPWDHPGIRYKISIPYSRATTVYPDFMQWIDSSSRPNYVREGYYVAFTPTCGPWCSAFEADDLVIMEEE